MLKPLQSKSVVVHPSQSAIISGQVTAAQTGIDISSILGPMLPVMVVVMMMKVMGSMVGGSTKGDN